MLPHAKSLSAPDAAGASQRVSVLGKASINLSSVALPQNGFILRNFVLLSVSDGHDGLLLALKYLRSMSLGQSLLR
jgi:hypothetical protein